MPCYQGPRQVRWGEMWARAALAAEHYGEGTLTWGMWRWRILAMRCLTAGR